MNGLAFLGLELAAVALVLVLLNARDRRRARTIVAVLGACPPALRGSVTIRARGSLLSRRVVLVLDLADYDDDVCPAIRRLAEARPPAVSLVIAARLGPALRIAVRVPARPGVACRYTADGRSPPCPHQPHRRPWSPSSSTP
jgi:hypothetical protein